MFIDNPSRRSWSTLGSQHKHSKKLFTPDIKRRLKQWLVERRQNPYPTRTEKKDLADATGLTYIQICNWFANWRRKLKNTGYEDQEQRKTWYHLIQTYNEHAKGNVEQVRGGSEEIFTWRGNSCFISHFSCQ